MMINTLNDRINNANAKIAKKQATIEKKTAWIAKKEATLDKLNEDDRYWAECNIRTWKEDIERNEEEIAETKKTIEKYQAQLAGEIEREGLLKDIPEVLTTMRDNLVKEWDEFDTKHRDFLKQKYNEMGYKKFIKEYGWAGREEMYKTNEEIHNQNEKDARTIILNLVNRVRDHVGEITDWSGIHVAPGNMWAVLNGYVVGKQGRCVVESILAGGYNIQRLHVRVLVKDFD